MKEQILQLSNVFVSLLSSIIISFREHFSYLFDGNSFTPCRPLISATCPIKNKLSSGAPTDIVLSPGKEQYCKPGEIVGFASDATINMELRCTSKWF